MNILTSVLIRCKNTIMPVWVICVLADFPNWHNGILIRYQTIGSQGYLKFPTLASHYTIKVGCWARLP